MEDSNAEVDMSLDETLNVVQHQDLRRLLPGSLQRHRVVKWPNFNFVSPSVPDDIRNLMRFFLFTLSVGVFNIFLYADITGTLFWTFTEELLMSGMIALVIFAVGVGVYVKMKQKNTDLAPQRKQVVQTISAPVQKV